MNINYHWTITRKALKDYFSPRALHIILRANLMQDVVNPRPECHYLENKISAAEDYINTQRALVLVSVLDGQPRSEGWKALGRLLHTAQDFYSHSNYVSLWAGRFTGNLPAPDQIDALDAELLQHPELHTASSDPLVGKIGSLPLIGKYFVDDLPEHVHARMNLDHPGRGMLFEYAYAAASKRTRYEYNRIVDLIHDPNNPSILRQLNDKKR